MKIEKTNEFAYSWAMPGVCKIEDRAYATSFSLDLRNIEIALKNVKERKADYATIEAYERQIRKYEGAIMFFKYAKQEKEKAVN